MAASLILALTVAISLLGLLRPRLIELGAFRPYRLAERGQIWTTLSSGFLHANGAHLLFNCLTFYFFAFPLQRVIGSYRFTLLYLCGLAASDAGTYLQHRRDPDYACLGASGAILAVLFASLVYFPRSSLFILPLPVPIPAPLFAIGYLAYSYLAARRRRGRINHDAHFYGALAGLAFVALSDPAVWRQAWRQLFG